MTGSVDLAISAQNLGKTYVSKSSEPKCALGSINLDIPRGSFFGLLGPNGAGKSTFINILAGLVLKTSGHVSVCGYDIDDDVRAVRYALGVVPQELVLDPFFTPKQVLENTAGYYGIRSAQRRTAEILEAVGLTDKANSPARRLSGGMRRRLLMAKAMVHSPDVLILDEPTAGVDVELRRQLWAYVKQLNDEGTTIVLTTHYLEEAQELCDEIAVINHGDIVACDKKSNLMRLIDHKKLIIVPRVPMDTVPDALIAWNATINPEHHIEIDYKPDEVSVQDILNAVCQSHIDIVDVTTNEPDLEDVFRYITDETT